MTQSSKHELVIEELSRIMPRRKAEAVLEKLQDCGVNRCTCRLHGLHVPAHFVTDLEVPANVVAKFGGMLNRFGAIMVR